MLNSLDLATLDEALAAFRTGLNEQTSPTEQLTRILSNPDAAKTQRVVQEYDQNVAALSEDVYYAMQISLEFIDKGMKGMLVGDLSSYALTTIEKIINRNEQKLNSIQKELEQALEELNQMENTEGAATVDSFYDARFGIDEEKL